MARPRTGTHRVSTPERILEAAEARFAIHGYEARLSDIAAAARIRRPSLLYHFPTKDALYEAVVARAFAGLGESLRAGRSAEGDFESRLRGLTVAFVAYVDTHPAVARVVVREILAEGGPGTAILMGRVAPLLDEVERWIAEAGAGVIRDDVPIRAALLQVVSDVLLRASAGDVREALWGPVDAAQAWAIARNVLLREGGSA